MEDLTIEAVSPANCDARKLLDELSLVLERITGSSGNASFDAADLVNGGVFVVARRHVEGFVGCGSIRRFDSTTAEIKRMFAKSPGVGQVVLADLAARARNMGYFRLILETRQVNVKAVKFYLRNGFRHTKNYGRYVGRDECVCFARDL